MDILKQRQWTQQELINAGFRPYERRKSVVLARELLPAEGPKRIKTAWDTLMAYPGYMICYDVEDGKRRAGLDAYDHWPVDPAIFRKTYRKWNDTAWKPNPAEHHLLDLGCKPYFKHAGVWAKKLARPGWIQSKESLEAVLVPVGGWLTIGIEGEPTSMTETEFHKRYLLARVRA